MGNDVPVFWMLDPGFLTFMAFVGICWLVWKAFSRFF